MDRCTQQILSEWDLFSLDLIWQGEAPVMQPKVLLLLVLVLVPSRHAERGKNLFGKGREGGGGGLAQGLSI